MFEPTVRRARDAGLDVRAYVSHVLRRPVGGRRPGRPGRRGRQAALRPRRQPAQPRRHHRRRHRRPRRPRCSARSSRPGMAVDQLAMHFHDTYGQALANTYAALAGRRHHVRRQRRRPRRLPLRQERHRQPRHRGPGLDAARPRHRDRRRPRGGRGDQRLDGRPPRPPQPVGGRACPRPGRRARAVRHNLAHEPASSTCTSVPPRPARPTSRTGSASTPARWPSTACTSRPGRRWSARRCSTSGPRSTCSARTGAARPATPRAPGTRWSRGSGAAVGHRDRQPRDPRAGRARPGRAGDADLAGSEVHVVYSARDLARQLPAAWQESIKQGRKWPFRRFLEPLAERGNAVVLPRLRPARPCSAPGAPGCRPSACTSSPCRRPAPAPATAVAALLPGFGIDPAWAPLDSDRANRSLGIAETQVLRQLNRRHQARHPPRGGVRRADPRRCSPRTSWSAATRRRSGCRPTASTGRRSRPSAGSSGCGAAASTWSATSRTCARCARPRASAGATPTGCRPKQAARAAALDALAAMTREAASRPDPERQLVRRVRAPGRSGCASGDRPAAEDTPGRTRAWGWVEHLRAGGTTPWRAWSRAARPAGGPAAARRPAARAAAPAQPRRRTRRRDLVERVLGARAPGRGQPDLELRRRPSTARRSGRRRSTPPTCPTRSCCGWRPGCSPRTSSRAGAGAAAEPRLAPGRGAARYRLVGDPALAGPARHELAPAAGRPAAAAPRCWSCGTRPDPRCSPTCGSTAASARAVPRWSWWLDALGAARRAAAARRPGRGRRTLGGPRRRPAGCRSSLDPAAPRPRRRPPSRPRRPAPVSADAADLARRVNAVLRLLVTAGAPPAAARPGAAARGSPTERGAGSSYPREHLGLGARTGPSASSRSCRALDTLCTATRTCCCPGAARRGGAVRRGRAGAGAPAAARGTRRRPGPGPTTVTSTATTASDDAREMAR